MKILIITGTFGMGHIVASNAIKQELQDSYPDADIQILDYIAALFPYVGSVFYKSYNAVVRNFPEFFNLAIKASDKIDAAPLKHIMSRKLNEAITAFSPDLIITTTPVSSKYLTYYKVKTKQIPMFTYITDIYCHRQWMSTSTDAYFVGAEKLKYFLISKGVSEQNIYVSGVPVRKTFEFDSDDKCADNEIKRVLIMGGGLGMIPGSDYFLKKLNDAENIRTTVIAGKNKKLYDELREKYKNIDVLGYTENVSEYMHKADVIISKPGGMTLFESICCITPMLVIKPELVHEEANARYIEEEGIGKVVWNDTCDIFTQLKTMLFNEAEYKKMQLNLIKIKKQRKYNLINEAIANCQICS